MEIGALTGAVSNGLSASPSDTATVIEDVLEQVHVNVHQIRGTPFCAHTSCVVDVLPMPSPVWNPQSLTAFNARHAKSRHRSVR